MNNLDDLYNGVRDRIFEIMELQQISQISLAKKIGVSAQTITDWKNGKSHSYVKDGMLNKIAFALEANIGYLWMGGEGPRTEYEKAQTEGFDVKLHPDRTKRIYVSDQEYKLITAYRAATNHAREMVDLALEPYKEKENAASVG